MITVDGVNQIHCLDDHTANSDTLNANSTFEDMISDFGQLLFWQLIVYSKRTQNLICISNFSWCASL